MKISELKKELKKEKTLYYDKNKVKRYFHILTKQPDIINYKAVKNAKIYRFLKENNKGIINKIKLLYYAKKVNKYATKYQIALYGSFGKNLLVCHAPVIVNGFSKIGNNVILHGMNCIGAKKYKDDAPNIGNNVDIGIGAIIIGNVTIADGIKIGANSIVTKSFIEPNITIAGNPAKKIKNNEV